MLGRKDENSAPAAMAPTNTPVDAPTNAPVKETPATPSEIDKSTNEVDDLPF